MIFFVVGFFEVHEHSQFGPPFIEVLILFVKVLSTCSLVAKWYVALLWMYEL